MGNDGNDGTLTAGPTWVSGRCPGTAINFNGSNYVAIPDHADYDGGTALTVSAWIKPSNNTDQTIAAKWTYQNPESWGFQISSGSATALAVYVAASQGDVGVNHYDGNSGVITSNVWQHVAFVYDGTLTAADRIKIYVNGTLTGGSITGTIPASMQASSAPLNIGYFGGALSRYFNGTIDDVRIYNHALSASVVADLYTSCPEQNAIFFGTMF